MGKKPGGAGAGWLATVRMVFKPSKDQRHAKKVHPALARVLVGSLLDKVSMVVQLYCCIDMLDHQQRGGDVEGTSSAGCGGEAAEIVSVDHFPTAETSPEVTNEGSGAVVWRERGEHEEVAAGARRGRRGVAAVTAAVPRTAAARGRAGGREERAAVRIQAFYRGYLVHNFNFY